MCCVPSRSGSWSPSSVSPSAAAWCRSPPLAARPFRRSLRLSGSRVTAQKHWEHEHQGNSECALYLQLTYWTMESPTITAPHPISWRGAKRLREEISKTRGGEGGGGHCPRPGLLLPLLHPGSVVSRRLSEGHLRRSRPGLRCAYSPRTCGHQLGMFPALLSAPSAGPVSQAACGSATPRPPTASNAARTRPYLHSKVDTNPPLKQVTVKQW